MLRISFLILVFCLALGCQEIETHKSLSKEQIKYIKSLGLLYEDEVIIKFYSEHTQKAAGNFFTDKRMAKYWIDKNDSSKNQRNSALYKEILNIDTVYSPGFTYCPYMMVHKKGGQSFKVCVEGEKEEVKSFFEEALALWKKEK
jgi:hypothetical protein